VRQRMRHRRARRSLPTPALVCALPSSNVLAEAEGGRGENSWRLEVPARFRLTAALGGEKVLQCLQRRQPAAPRRPHDVLGAVTGIHSEERALDEAVE
jgi:hypothetical protein